ncbi:ArsR/SmtB family transcription factor [Naumannella halotolerans]|nr:metalloregulator ArsR/SmtB family transcription factor [Naumannella halotolerans]
MTEQPTPQQLEVVARIFDLLGNPSRLHLLALAADGERDVSALAQAAGVTLTAASQHLSKMRLAGLVSARRQGRRLIYVVDDPHIVTVVRQMFEHIAPDGSLAPDPPLDPSIQGPAAGRL